MQKQKKKTVFTKEEEWQRKKPKYNGFACGYGVHGSCKYNRRSDKAHLRHAIDEYEDR